MTTTDPAAAATHAARTAARHTNDIAELLESAAKRLRRQAQDFQQIAGDQQNKTFERGIDAARYVSRTVLTLINNADLDGVLHAGADIDTALSRLREADLLTALDTALDRAARATQP